MHGRLKSQHSTGVRPAYGVLAAPETVRVAAVARGNGRRFPMFAGLLAALIIGVTGLISQWDSAFALAIGTYDQCSNDDGDGYASGDPGCRWTNGNLQRNNSTYSEGDATVQRLWLTDLAPGSHTVTLKYGTTKGGKHAYDFLTQYNWSETYVDKTELCQATSGGGTITGCTGWPENTLGIPPDGNVPDTIEGQSPGGRVFTMYNGFMDSATFPAIVSGTACATPGGACSGDSETVVTITFDVGAGAPANSQDCTANGCSVLLAFGAHISRQADWGTGTSAVYISGSPYHVALDQVDGASVGQRDNQMQAGAIVSAPIITTQASVTSIALGGSVTDTATLAGFDSGEPGQNPAAVVGTVQFYLCGPDLVATECATDGIAVGTPVTVNSGLATSIPYTPTSAGFYCFRVGVHANQHELPPGQPHERH